MSTKNRMSGNEALGEAIRQINPDADNAIRETSDRLREAAQLYAVAIADETGRTVSDCPDGTKRIDIDALRKSASAESLLYEILSPFGYNESQVRDIMLSLDSESGRRFQTSDAILIKDRSALILRMNRSQVPFSGRLEVRDGACSQLPDGRAITLKILAGDGSLIRDSRIAMLDADRLQPELTVRTWRNGDSFVPLGMKGRKLISDFMTDAKMTLLQKESQIVVCSGEDIVWVAGRRIDNRYRINGSTDRIAVLEYVCPTSEEDRR